MGGLGYPLRTGGRREGSRCLQFHSFPLDGRGATEFRQPPPTLEKGGGQGWGAGRGGEKFSQEQAGLPSPQPSSKTDGVGSWEGPSGALVWRQQKVQGSFLMETCVCLSVTTDSLTSLYID